jgi:ADP-heptose:LPS heptosyltransferase
LLLTFLKGCDTFLSQVPLKKLESPKKILLANLAHMGDVVTATSVLKPLKKIYPEAEIGFLIGSGSKDVLEGNPLVSKLHVVDHWKLNRSFLSFPQKVFRYFEMKKKAIQEIQATNYDCAIDLYPYFPNAIHLLSKTEIPCRVGYTSGGFGPLLTDPFLWIEKSQSITHYYADLLGIKEDLFPFLIGEPFDLPEAFVVLHVGSGNPKKEQPFTVWKRVIEYFARRHYPLFLTGRGCREKENIDKLIDQTGYGVSLCDQLTWKQLVFSIQKAKLMVSTDTVVMHIASSFKTPNLVLAPNLQRLWKPDNPFCRSVEGKNIIQVLQEAFVL